MQSPILRGTAVPVKLFGIPLTKKVVATVSTTSAGLLLTVVTIIAKAAWADHNTIASQQSSINTLPSIAASTQARAMESAIMEVKMDNLNDKFDTMALDVRYLVRRGGGVPAHGSR